MFDRQVVDALLRFVPLYPKGTTVLLSNGRTGIIYENAGIHNLRPILRMTDGTMMDMADSRCLNLALAPVDVFYEEIETAEKSRHEMIKLV